MIALPPFSPLDPAFPSPSSRAQVLAGDFSGDGELELLLGTMNGRLLAIRARGVPAHPLEAWHGAPRARRNGFAHGRHEV